MGLKAWKERLNQIKMSEFDAELYDRYAEAVRGQIKSLRVILESLQVHWSTQINLHNTYRYLYRQFYQCESHSFIQHYAEIIGQGQRETVAEAPSLWRLGRDKAD